MTDVQIDLALAESDVANGILRRLLAAVPHLVVERGSVIGVSPSMHVELGIDSAPLLGPLDEIGTRLDDSTFEDLCLGLSELRVRLTAELSDRPVRLRYLGADDDRIWLEVRSLANEFRAESLLRRSGMGHMLLSPTIELQWSMTSNDLAEVFPGDNPLNWVELMDPDDMQTLGKAIFKVGQDPNLRKTVRHRLNADRTYTIIDTVESVVHDPDLRSVLVRSRLEDAAQVPFGGAAPFAGITVSDHMPIGVVVASVNGKVLHRNAVAAELIGASAGQSVTPDGDNSMVAQLSAEHVAAFHAAFESACAGRPAHCAVPAPLDQRRWLRLSVSPAAASTVVMTIEDITELAEAERALRASNRLLEALDSHSEDLVLVFDAQGQARYTSSSVRRHLSDETTIAHIDDVAAYVHFEDQAVLEALAERVRSTPAASEDLELRLDVEHGQKVGEVAARWNRATMTNLLDDHDVQGLVLTLRDVHERHLADRDLRYRATHDSLTTLPDRAALIASLDTILREAAAADRRTGLIFCDIDHFKLVNDRYGHATGDLVLTEVAVRLRSALRTRDIVGRFGGDEFVIVVWDVADEADAYALAARVFAKVAGPVACGEISIEVSVSMGIAVTDPICMNAASLLERADRAMYQAKRDGRGRLSLYDTGAMPVA